MLLEFFPPVVLALNSEILKHPTLMKCLHEVGEQPLEVRVGIIAAYCEIILDDFYLEEDLEILFNLLLRRLQKKSALTVN